MNLLSFLDELTKLGTATYVVKKAYGGGLDTADVNTVDIPHGMMSDDYVQPGDRVHPAEARTRLPHTADRASVVPTGTQGGITESKDPIDRFKYNRAYRDRR